MRVRWWKVITQMGRFGIVGIANTVLDLCLFNALLWLFPTHSAVLLLVYNTIAYAVGAIDSFLLNKYWTFKRKHAATRGEVARFMLTTGAGILCSDLILWIAGMLLSHVGGNVILLNNLAKLLAVAGTCSVSYLGMHLWVFVRRSEHEGQNITIMHIFETTAGNGLSYPAEQRSLSVILPAYNEEEVIIATVEKVLQTLETWHIEYEVIVVNDGSKDLTGVLLAELAERSPRLHVVTHPTNKGYGAALISGFEAASKELSFFMDSDGQFSIEELHQFLPFAASYDAVIGYRLQRQDNWVRTLNAWGWKQVIGLVLGVRVRDIDCAFKLYHSDFVHRQHLETQGAMINAEMLYKLQREGGLVKQIGVHHLPRQGGKATGANIKVIVRAFKELLVYSRQWRTEVPQRVPEKVTHR